MVDRKHVRILREALAGLANRTQGPIREHCIKALTDYAKAIAPKCEHPEQVKLYNYKACVDCGFRQPHEAN